MLRKTSWPIPLLLLILISLMIGGCTASPVVVKVGLVGPFTGRYRDIGYDVIYSSRLAVRQFNENGRSGDIRLALVALDDFGDKETAEKNAQALALDSKVVVVVGHWLPETTEIARIIYEQNGLPFINTGQTPFGVLDPTSLPEQFSRDYDQLTPFDEMAGPYAASGYDALQLAIAAVEAAAEQSGSVDRQSIEKNLKSLTIQGLSGEIYQK